MPGIDNYEDVQNQPYRINTQQYERALGQIDQSLASGEIDRAAYDMYKDGLVERLTAKRRGQARPQPTPAQQLGQERGMAGFDDSMVGPKRPRPGMNEFGRPSIVPPSVQIGQIEREQPMRVEVGKPYLETARKAKIAKNLDRDWAPAIEDALWNAVWTDGDIKDESKFIPFDVMPKAFRDHVEKTFVGQGGSAPLGFDLSVLQRDSRELINMLSWEGAREADELAADRPPAEPGSALAWHRPED